MSSTYRTFIFHVDGTARAFREAACIQTWTGLWTGLWNERGCVARKAERRENSLSGTKRCILLIIVPIIMIIIGILHYILFSDPLRTLITRFSHFLPLVATQLRSPGLKFTRPTIRVIKDFSRAVWVLFPSKKDGTIWNTLPLLCNISARNGKSL